MKPRLKFYQEAEKMGTGKVTEKENLRMPAEELLNEHPRENGRSVQRSPSIVPLKFHIYVPTCCQYTLP